MKLKMIRILIICVVVLLLSLMIVTAESDPTEDIYHQIVIGTDLSWEPYTGEKAFIDITDISYTLDGSQVTLTMTLADDIISSAFIKYYMHLRTDEIPLYTATYSDGYASLIGPDGNTIIDNPVSENMFTATFDVSDPNLEYIAWGYAGEYTDEANPQVEAWLDYAPESLAPWYSDGGDGDDTDNGNDDDNEGNGGNDNGSNGGTPGFELIAVLTAFGLALILFKRRK